jgi:hypothetical protein
LPCQGGIENQYLQSRHLLIIGKLLIEKSHHSIQALLSHKLLSFTFTEPYEDLGFPGLPGWTIFVLAGAVTVIFVTGAFKTWIH